MRNKIIQIFLLGLLIVYLFYGFDFKKIDFSKFSFYGIVLTFIIVLFSQFVLSLRWMKMSYLSFQISLETIIVSSALNMILPAKLGELSKALYLKKFYAYNYHKTLSVIFVERFFDVIVLFLLLCIWAYNYTTNQTIQYALIFLGGFIGVVLLFFSMSKMFFLLEKIPFQFLRVYLKKIYKIIHKMFQSPLSLIFYTMLLWSFYFFGAFIFFTYGVSFSLDITTILGLFIFSTLAMSLPLAPAGIGTYEAAVVFYLGGYGIGKEDALLAATLYHMILFGVDFFLFSLFLLFKEIKFNELINKE